MFVQVIEGRVSDREGLHRQMDKWMGDLRPGATGFLGSTAGVTDDGYGIAFARFESAAAAKTNSERPEQGRWWAETEKCFAGEVTFTDSEDVETSLGPGTRKWIPALSSPRMIEGSGLTVRLTVQLDPTDRAVPRWLRWKAQSGAIVLIELMPGALSNTCAEP